MHKIYSEWRIDTEVTKDVMVDQYKSVYAEPDSNINEFLYISDKMSFFYNQSSDTKNPYKKTM
mgnify:CR=1 FL=1